ncbi:MAG: hypothetical protein ACK5PS_15485, partial [Desulfopila sp.]
CDLQRSRSGFLRAHQNSPISKVLPPRFISINKFIAYHRSGERDVTVPFLFQGQAVDIAKLSILADGLHTTLAWEESIASGFLRVQQP